MAFINPDFMLQTETAKKLYHEHAEKMPIIDYHCHLVPQQIASSATLPSSGSWTATTETTISGVPCVPTA